MARKTPQEWAEIRAAYRRGEGSLRELAERHQVPFDTLKKRAAKESWAEERHQVGTEAATRAIEGDIESVAAMLAKHRRAAARFTELALQRLEDLAKDVDDEGRSALTTAQLDALSGVVARMVPVERLAAGVERIKPVVGLDAEDDVDVVFEIDAPEAEPELEDDAPAPKSEAA
jgi:hypothetical protein